MIRVVNAKIFNIKKKASKKLLTLTDAESRLAANFSSSGFSHHLSPHQAEKLGTLIFQEVHGMIDDSSRE